MYKVKISGTYSDTYFLFEKYSEAFSFVSTVFKAFRSEDPEEKRAVCTIQFVEE